jgi:glycosyltransferase involved in cell wall biosynthesis
MSQIKFYFYTNLLAPYMFHRWKMISEAYPGSMVILTRKPDPARPWKYRPEEMEFPCVNYPETIKLSNHLSWSKGLRQFVKKTNTKGIIHLFEDVSGLNILNILRVIKKETFLLINDGGFPETTKRFSQKIRWNLIGNKCFGVITAGEIGNKYMQAWGFPSEKIYNSYLSHDIKAFTSYRDSELGEIERSMVRDSLKIDNGSTLVLCNSRLLDWKRIEDLYGSINYVSEKARNKMFLLLLGDGNHKEPLNNLLKLNSIRFKWIPSVSYNEVMKYHLASDIFVLPSEGDIWGLVVNEALSMGKPVICTNRIGASQLVKNEWNGFKINARDPKALAISLEKLILDDKLRHTLSENARSIENTWQSNLLITELHKLIEDIYKSI